MGTALDGVISIKGRLYFYGTKEPSPRSMERKNRPLVPPRLISAWIIMPVKVMIYDI